MIEATTSTHHLVERLRRVLADAPGVVVAHLYGAHARGAGRTAIGCRRGTAPWLRWRGTAARAYGSDHASRRAGARGRRHPQTTHNQQSYRVLRHGKVLVSRDDQTRVEHWVRTVDRYLDTAPARRILAAGTRNRLREGRFGRR